MHEKLPDFFIVGAAKAGTSSLYAYLNEHPQIFMSPIKETNFFAYEGRNTTNFHGRPSRTNFPVKTIQQYKSLFTKCNNDQVIGEASPLYLESGLASERIYKLLPDAKIIAILRNPIDRAFSGYTMAVRHGNQKPLNIMQALHYSSHYVQVGFYYDKLLRYYKFFPASQIKVYLFEDFCQNSVSVLRDIFNFLCVNNTYMPNVNIKYNVGRGLPKSYMLSKMLRKTRKIYRIKSMKYFLPSSLEKIARWLNQNNVGDKIEFPVSLRKNLMQVYKEDILKVQNLIDRDLSIWFEGV